MIEAMNKERCELLGEYMIEQMATVRSAAHHFSISKSTVHKDITEKLKECNPELYERVKGVLDLNKSERHLRGGEATRKMYLRKKRIPK